MKIIVTSREIQTHTPLELMRLALNRFFFAAKKDYEVKQFKESPTFGGGEIFEIEIQKIGESK